MALQFLIKHFLKDKRFYKFLVIGVINTAFGYLIYALFIFMHINYSLAILFSTIVGVFFNFKTTGKFVFQNSKNHLIFKFIGVYVIIYLLNVSLIKIALFWISDLYLCGLMALIIVAPTAFLLNKVFVFKGKYETN